MRERLIFPRCSLTLRTISLNAYPFFSTLKTVVGGSETNFCEFTYDYAYAQTCERRFLRILIRLCARQRLKYNYTCFAFISV